MFPGAVNSTALLLFACPHCTMYLVVLVFSLWKIFSYEKYFQKVLFWFYFRKRNANREVFTGCPRRKCQWTSCVFSQKLAIIVLGFAFFPEYIYLETPIVCSPRSYFHPFDYWGIGRMCYSHPNADAIFTCSVNISFIVFIAMYTKSSMGAGRYYSSYQVNRSCVFFLSLKKAQKTCWTVSSPKRAWSVL